MKHLKSGVDALVVSHQHKADLACNVPCLGVSFIIQLFELGKNLLDSILHSSGRQIKNLHIYVPSMHPRHMLGSEETPAAPSPEDDPESGGEYPYRGPFDYEPPSEEETSSEIEPAADADPPF